VNADDGRFYQATCCPPALPRAREADELRMQDAPNMAAQLNAKVHDGPAGDGIDLAQTQAHHSDGGSWPTVIWCWAAAIRQDNCRKWLRWAKALLFNQ